MNTIMKVAVTANAVARSMKEGMTRPIEHRAEKRDARSSAGKIGYS